MFEFQTLMWRLTGYKQRVLGEMTAFFRTDQRVLNRIWLKRPPQVPRSGKIDCDSTAFKETPALSGVPFLILLNIYFDTGGYSNPRMILSPGSVVTGGG